jgi:hypothetical protein
MTIPHYINEDRSDMRAIKSGWYAMEDDGNLSSGPFSSHAECLRRIKQPPGPARAERIDRVLSCASMSEVKK